MPTKRKVETVGELTALIAANPSVVMTEYRGLSVSDLEDLRRKLRQAGVEYRVSKNTLTKIAAEKAGRKEFDELLSGPVAIAFSKDETAPAKVLTEYIRTSRKPLVIRGGVVGKRVLSADQINTLATLPSKEELLAKMMGSMQSPIAGLLNVLNGNLRGLVTVLNGRIGQLEGNS